MHQKEIKYGYFVEARDKSFQIVKPSNLTKISLTPKNQKFIFQGTRYDILKWMSSHPELLVEYDPFDQELEFSPTSSLPSSPLFSTFPEVPEIILSSPTSIKSSLSFSSDNIPQDIVFDLFTIPVKTSAVLSEEKTFSRPLNIALNCIPWIEVTLEIRPVNKRVDSKLFPIHRVILPSGSSLLEVSKALEKSWKSLIPDSTAFAPDCFIRNNELLYPHKKPRSTPCDDNEVEDNEVVEKDDDYKPSSRFITGIAKHFPTVDLWLRQKQTSGAIPPGVLTPYIIEDVLRDLDCENENEIEDNEIVNKQILLDEESEAELEKELIRPDLPKYETVFNDKLLERGQPIKSKKCEK